MSDFFWGTRPGRAVTRGGTTFDLPILYYRDDMFGLFFGADYTAVRRVMPSQKLHPVSLPGGRAVMAVAAFNYMDTSIGPYGEVAVVAPAVYGDRPPLPLLPGILEARYPGFGSLVLHLPVTTRTARDAGRGEWGYAKFVADMHFVNTPEYQECRLSEAGTHILTLQVPRAGIPMRDRKPMVTWSVSKGRLVKTTIPQHGTCRNCIRPRNAYFGLGDHPVAQSIRDLGLSPRPFLSRYYVERAAILDSGIVVEEKARPLEGYAGTDRDGELTVEYLNKSEG